jgi:hypothetical protein
VLFEHQDVDPRAGQQKPQHHPRRPAAGNAARVPLAHGASLFK